MNKKIITISAIAVALVGLIALGIYSMSTPNNTTARKPNPIPEQNTSNFIRFHSPSFGNTASPVKVIEWFDPECEACRAFHPAFTRIVADYSDKVHFVLRYMPFHSNSLYAASLLEEARELGKFKEALDIILEKQPEWGNHHSPRPELLPTYLVKLGIAKEKLERSYVIQKHGTKVKQDEDDGLKAGVTGTPTFFVDGRKISGLSEESLRSAITTALNKAK